MSSNNSAWRRKEAGDHHAALAVQFGFVIGEEKAHCVVDVAPVLTGLLGSVDHLLPQTDRQDVDLATGAAADHHRLAQLLAVPDGQRYPVFVVQCVLRLAEEHFAQPL